MISLTIKSLQTLLDAGDPDVKYKTSLPSRAYMRTQAEVVNAPPQVEDYRQWVAKQVATPPDLLVVSLTNTIVWGNGIVILRNEIVLLESLINLHDAKELFEMQRTGPDTITWLPPPQVHRLQAVAPVIIKQTWDEHYGHWLIEGLPRAFWWSRLFAHLPSELVLQTPQSAQMKSVVLDSLLACGVPESRLIFTLNTLAYEADEWFYVSPITVQPWVKSGLVFEAVEQLRRSLVSPLTQDARPRNIYLSRNRQKNRRMLNEDAVLDILARDGYEVLCVEELSLAEQAAAFFSAQNIVGNLGGAFSNIAFCRPGTKILALVTPWMFDDFFWDMASHVGASYHAVHGHTDSDLRSMQLDFSMPLDIFTQVYERWKRAA